MGRGLNLNDPLVKRYLNSIDPKNRKMLEDLYKPKELAERRVVLKKLAEQRRDASKKGGQ
jgi:hypothetical protein